MADRAPYGWVWSDDDGWSYDPDPQHPQRRGEAQYGEEFRPATRAELRHWVDRARSIETAASDLEQFLHNVVQDDPDSSPVVIQCQGEDSDLYAEATRARLSALRAALRKEPLP